MVCLNKKKQDVDICSLQKMHSKHKNTVMLTLKNGGRHMLSKMN